MIKCALFEFTRGNGRGCISDELRKKPGLRAMFDNRCRELKKHGVGSEETRSFCASVGDGIYKFQVHSKPQLRPHLCKGPKQMEAEATFLVFATEENWKLYPPDAKEIAIERRNLVLADDTRKKPL